MPTVTKCPRELATECFWIIYSNISIIYTQLDFKFEFDSSNIPSQSYISGHIHRLAKYYTLLWRQLTCPHPTTVRFHIYEIVIFIEKLILLLSRCNRIEFKFHQPIFPCNPSATHQIVYQPTTILDPTYCLFDKTIIILWLPKTQQILWWTTSLRPAKTKRRR